jgi:hypothetical protein
VCASNDLEYLRKRRHRSRLCGGDRRSQSGMLRPLHRAGLFADELTGVAPKADIAEPSLTAIAHHRSMSAFVKGFGCRPIATVGQAPGPVSESLQGKNPRGVGYGECRGLWGFSDRRCLARFSPAAASRVAGGADRAGQSLAAALDHATQRRLSLYLRRGASHQASSAAAGRGPAPMRIGTSAVRRWCCHEVSILMVGACHDW